MHLGFALKYGEFFEYVIEYRLFKKESTPWRCKFI